MLAKELTILFRMRQFYETYRYDEKVSPLVRQLPWTHNLLIMSRCKQRKSVSFICNVSARALDKTRGNCTNEYWDRVLQTI